MARDHGRIYSRIWDDADFTALKQNQQSFYFFLLTQKNLSKAGVLPVTLRRWAKSAADLDTKGVLRLLFDLDRARFLVWDDETEEVLIRTFIRGDEVYKQPNMMQAATAAATEIVSPRLRRALLAEIDRLPLDEVKNEPTKSGGQSARATVEACIETLRRTLSVPEPPEPDRRETLPERDAETLPGTLPETHAAPLEGRVLARDTETLESDSDWFDRAPEESVQLAEPEGTLPAWVPERDAGTPYARAHAHSPTTEPFPEPLPPPAGGGEPPRQQPLLAVIEGGADTVAETDGKPEPTTTDELIADWIEHMPKRPPGQVIGRVGKHIKAMLAEGIDPADVRAGIAAWARKGKDPSVLPSIVNEVMNSNGAARTGSRPPADDLGTEAHLNRYLARAAVRKAREA